MSRDCQLDYLDGYNDLQTEINQVSQFNESGALSTMYLGKVNMSGEDVRVNLAFPLIWDTFAILGSSKCECLSVLDLKDAYHKHQTSREFQTVLWVLPFFWSS